jgi:Ser/Thr protein kinase RdoA (MazF antagonist)
MKEFERLTPGGQVRRLRRLAEQALRVYGIQPVSISLLSHFHNTTFAVDGADGARYVLRIHRGESTPLDAPRRRARLEAELWWLNRLRMDQAVPVPEAILTPGGEQLLEITVNGVTQPRLCVLFRWMEGRFLERGLRPVHLEDVGRLTGKLHEHSAQLTVPAGFERQCVDRTDGEFEEYVARLFGDWGPPNSAGVMREVLHRVRRAQEELGSGPARFGLIHADVHQYNYLFSGVRARLIDFDDCGWGHYLYDPAVTLLHVDSLPRGPALRAAYLRGYRQVRALSAREEELIETFIMLRLVQDASWDLQERDTVSFGGRAALVADRVATLERWLTRSRA